MNAPTKTVWVAGASGMLGKPLARRLESRYRVLGFSSSGQKNTIACDLSDISKVRALLVSNPPDLVVHSAAYSDVDGCERDPQRARQANAISVKNLCEVLAPKKVPLVYISTDYVFDGQKRTLYLENDKTDPVNIYGLTKLEGEYYALSSKIPTVVLRTSWLFGPENPKTFVNAIWERLKKEKEISVLDDQVDSPTSVEDLSQAVLKVCEWLESASGRPELKEVFHFCNSGATTRYDMALAMRDFSGLSDRIVRRADPSQIQGRLAVRPVYASMDCHKFESFFGVKIRPWQQSLREYMEASL